MRLGGSVHRVYTAGGVFSPEHVDRGTDLLLRTFAEELANGGAGCRAEDGAILDLGCGWGPIALDAALRLPTRPVWAVDVNERARALTAQNAAALGCQHLRVAAPQEVPQEQRFSLLLSNPPIRVGKAALHTLMRTWLPRLEPGGRALLVVAKQLGAESLQRWISAEFPGVAVSRLARDKGFHVIEVRS